MRADYVLPGLVAAFIAWRFWTSNRFAADGLNGVLCWNQRDRRIFN
jgi:hypothetical protein